MKIKAKKGVIPVVVIIAIAVAAAILMIAGTASYKIFEFSPLGFGISAIVAIAIVLYILKKADSK